MKTDRRRIRARSHYEVELGLPLHAVIGQVHTGIHVLVRNPGVVGNIAAPFARIVTQEVIALSWQFVAGRNLGQRMSANQLHAHYGRRSLALFWILSEQDRRAADSRRFARCRAGMKREHSIIRRQEKGVSIASCHVLDLSIGLPLILFECERKSSVDCLNSTARGSADGFRLGCDRPGRSRDCGAMMRGRRNGKQCEGNNGEYWDNADGRDPSS